jgi:hypothetical protein
MPQCKNCREPAVDGPWHKQYCREHGEAYLAKRKEYERRRALLPDCATEGCSNKVPPWKAAVESDLCHECATLAEEEEAEDRKQRQFDQAETVEELKDWIKEYVL